MSYNRAALFVFYICLEFNFKKESEYLHHVLPLVTNLQFSTFNTIANIKTRKHFNSESHVIYYKPCK